MMFARGGLLFVLSIYHALSAQGVVHLVQVGQIIDNNQFRYTPDTTYAQVGDVVTFQFFPTNHSVVRAEYGSACIPYEMTGQGKTGFFSGEIEIPQITDDLPTWNLTINDTQPIFFYCTAIDSCTPNGMVGVINPNASQTLQSQYEDALDAKYMLVPGQPFPAEGSSLPAPISTGNNTTSVSSGAIVGIVIGSVALVTIISGLFFFICCKKTHGRMGIASENDGNVTNGPSNFVHHAKLTANNVEWANRGSSQAQKIENGSVEHYEDNRSSWVTYTGHALANNPEMGHRYYSPIAPFAGPIGFQEPSSHCSPLHSPQEIEANEARRTQQAVFEMPGTTAYPQYSILAEM